MSDTLREEELADGCGEVSREHIDGNCIWEIYVERVGEGWTTYFRRGVQYFALARSEDPDEGEAHCRFMGKAFAKALRTTIEMETLRVIPKAKEK